MAQAQHSHTTALRGTILLVDDHPSIRLILANGLRANGWTVLVAGSGTEALRLCSTYRGTIDVLVTDLGLVPDALAARGGEAKGVANGLELLGHVSALRPSIRTLLISGHSDERLARLGVKREQVEILRKPFDLKALLQRVTEVGNR